MYIIKKRTVQNICVKGFSKKENFSIQNLNIFARETRTVQLAFTDKKKDRNDVKTRYFASFSFLRK
jgi:hypothetical protein